MWTYWNTTNWDTVYIEYTGYKTLNILKHFNTQLTTVSGGRGGGHLVNIPIQNQILYAFVWGDALKTYLNRTILWLIWTQQYCDLFEQNNTVTYLNTTILWLIWTQQYCDLFEHNSTVTYLNTTILWLIWTQQYCDVFEHNNRRTVRNPFWTYLNTIMVDEGRDVTWEHISK